MPPLYYHYFTQLSPFVPGITNHEEYSLIVELPDDEKEKTLTLKRDKSIAKDQKKLEEMRRRLHTEDEGMLITLFMVMHVDNCKCIVFNFFSVRLLSVLRGHSVNFFSVRLLSVLHGHSVFFIPATTANDLRLRRIFLFQILCITFIFLSWFLRKSQYFPFECSVLSKQGNYWYHFYNVFGLTRSLTGDWTWDLPHSEPALYH